MLRRRWLTVLVPLVLVPAVVFVFSSAQTKVYEATAGVVLEQRDLGSALAGIAAPTAVDRARHAQTQADLAMTPEVAGRTLEALALDADPQSLLDATRVEPRPGSDFLEVRVEDESPSLAVRLADEYGRQYLGYRAELDAVAIVRARNDLEARLDELESSGESGSAIARSLRQRDAELAALQAIETEPGFLAAPAGSASEVSPRPWRDVLLAAIAGLGLGLLLALVVDALDSRVRSTAEIGDLLDLPLLARLPRPPDALADENEIVMLAQPTGTHAEAFRMLRSNLDYALLDARERTILVTSAIDREGKSTTAANLAVALARLGRRVALVDLDLRRPYINRFFGLPVTPGISDVALGRVPLIEAVAPIDLGTGHAGARNGSNGAARNGSADHGTLVVLAAGPLPPNPGEFVSTERVADILRELAHEVDVVIVDSPPLLRVGDAMTLSSRVSAILLVTRLKRVRRPMLGELRRLLDAVPAAKLGYVVTGASGEVGREIYGSGYSYGYGQFEDEPIAEKEQPAPA